MLYWLAKTISMMVRLMPEGLRLSVGKMLGLMMLKLIPAWRRKMAMDNIARSLNTDEAMTKKIYEKSTRRFGNMLVEVFDLPWLTREKLDARVSFRGEEHLRQALEAGQGCILATSHSGNWELLGAALALHGFPLVAVVQKQKNAEMDRFINEYRSRAGMHVTYKTGVRDMVRLLGEGRIIGLLMDQDTHSEDNYVDFFARRVPAPQGAAALARMKRVPIVPAFITETATGEHLVIIEPAVNPEWSDDRDGDISRVTQELTTIIEEHIKKYPQDWFWLHNRWKHEQK